MFNIGHTVGGGINPRFQNIGVITAIRNGTGNVRFRTSNGRLMQAHISQIVPAPKSPNRKTPPKRKRIITPNRKTPQKKSKSKKKK